MAKSLEAKKQVEHKDAVESHGDGVEKQPVFVVDARALRLSLRADKEHVRNHDAGRQHLVLLAPHEEADQRAHASPHALGAGEGPRELRVEGAVVVMTHPAAARKGHLDSESPTGFGVEEAAPPVLLGGGPFRFRMRNRPRSGALCVGRLLRLPRLAALLRVPRTRALVETLRLTVVLRYVHGGFPRRRDHLPLRASTHATCLGCAGGVLLRDETVLRHEALLRREAILRC
mmetsp:Transcript_63414/g.183733  ORF Transcript_63414/g.183733 Transcript_63414/m.183733 type:complete len:231 (+) Transcript_63414:1256-1948(+)